MSIQVPEVTSHGQIFVTVNANTGKLNTAQTSVSTAAVFFMLILNYTARISLINTILAVFALALPK